MAVAVAVAVAAAVAVAEQKVDKQQKKNEETVDRN